MNGAGFMMEANKSLKNNRALLKKKAPFEIQKMNLFSPKPANLRTIYRFRKATPEYLKQLKTRLRRETRRSFVKKGIVLLFALSVTLYIFWWIGTVS